MAALAALVLAAGRSSRFGDDKLLQIFADAPIVTHAIRAACAAPVARIVIVKRPGAALDQACRDAAVNDARISLLDVESEALSASLRAGLAALSDSAGAFIFLGDMPLVPHHAPALLAEKLDAHFAALPMFEGRPGHPVLLSARAVGLAQSLDGDQGAGVLLRQYADDVARLEMDDDGVVFDVDTLADYQRLSSRDM